MVGSGKTYMRPKDSIVVVWACDRVTEKELEAADRQTLSAHHSKIGKRQLNIYLSAVQNWEQKRQHYIGDSTELTDVFQNSENLMEFLLCSRYLPPPLVV